ncbi:MULTISPECIES: TetR/AcrR family transcriptional regulator [Actinomadura]|uniref:TetR/AcrR family transcriptional regulator n=1 Tax=Actinomadura yumaensis TaxID=111807 RepID=A0ABW2CJT8_9ACTN|nr:TetR/AcrR family transcriptional regulator [Actinomadura sp. J1-007]MWK39831.1 TetR family transcriptional regulator [Actinomadura sp. J1-007]
METEGSLRERLVDVGVELVLTEGVAALGLREIARRAGVSHGAPRRYFPSHQALLSAIARRGFADLAERSAEALDGARSPRARLRALACAYVRYAQDRPGMFELMFRHDLLRGQERAAGRTPLREASLPLFRRVTELVARHQEENGARRGVPAETTAVALWSNVHGLTQLWSWGSIGLALGTDDSPRSADGPGGPDAPDRPESFDQLDRLLDAVLDAHLGEVGA